MNAVTSTAPPQAAAASPMPGGLIDRLTQEQIADLLDFLQSVPPKTSTGVR